MNKTMSELKENSDQDWGFFIEIDAQYYANKRDREKDFKKMYWEKNRLEKINEEECEEEKYFVYDINDTIEGRQDPRFLFTKCSPYELFHLGTATIVFISLGYFMFCIS